MRSDSTGPTWRGWVGRGDEGAVVSERRPGRAARSRLFPKTRSWFVLGAPIELLSPLSVLRIVLAVDAVAATGLGVAGRRSAVAPAVALAPALLAVGAWLALARVRSVGRPATVALLLLGVADAAGLVAVVRGTALVAGAAFLLVPVGVAAGLFLRLRSLVAVAAAMAGATTAALATGGHPVAAVAAAPLVLAGTTTAMLAVHFLHATIERRGRTDADTGLPNGFGLAEAVRLRGGWSRFLVAAVLLDGIAEVREALGYRVGTELVRRAAEDLGQVLPADALVGRVVADELVVLAPLPAEPDQWAPGEAAGSGGAAGADGLDGGGDHRAGSAPVIPPATLSSAEALSGAIVQALGSGRYVAGELELALRPHVGLAVAPYEGEAVEELVRRASLRAPHAASNGLSFAHSDGSRPTMTADDLELLAALRLAGTRQELSLAYQPQVEAATGRTVAVEALLRWSSSHHGRVSPGRFIPLAERTGLVDRLTEWVVATALDAQVRWRERGLDLPVSVNLSARSLTRPDLARLVLDALDERGLPPGALTVELTETAEPADLARAVQLLAPLHDAGVRVSLDDFGAGYTSLSVLARLPLDELKCDQRFVLDAPTSPAAAAIVATVRELAYRLGLTAVAEGVEEEAHRAVVVEAGYDLLQGFHFSRPLPELDLLASLDRAPVMRTAAGAPRRASPGSPPAR